MKNLFLESADRNTCCGCMGCVQACPTRVLKADMDSEGFYYPKMIAEGECVDCGICKSVCPMENSSLQNEKKEIVAALSKDEKILQSSSSGGIFAEAAHWVIAKGGIVYGVEMNDTQVCYKRADKAEAITSLLGSKYVQANTNGVYTLIKQDVLRGNRVLVCSTPCFIAGLKLFLKKPFDNLVTMDLICHGVPSQKIFDKYITSLGKEGEISNYKFRDKRIYGWGISGTYEKRGKTKARLTVSSPYEWAYLKNYLHRPSCYHCPYAKEDRPGDLTIGDFWNMDKVACGLDYSKGISIVKINNQAGCAFLEELSQRLLVESVDYAKSLLTNEALYQPSPFHKNRDLIYQNMDTMNFKKMVKKYFNMPNQFIVQSKKLMPQGVKNKLKKLFK